jgi:hypothetical protein
MIAMLAASLLSFGHAKAAIATYEHAYWQPRHPTAVTSVLACRRRSRAAIACVAYTRIVEGPGKVLHVTTTDTARALRGGIVKVEPGHYGIIDLQTTLE